MREKFAYYQNEIWIQWIRYHQFSKIAVENKKIMKKS